MSSNVILVMFQPKGEAFAPEKPALADMLSFGRFNKSLHFFINHHSKLMHFPAVGIPLHLQKPALLKEQ
jgi:hypothetical protein